MAKLHKNILKSEQAFLYGICLEANHTDSAVGGWKANRIFEIDQMISTVASVPTLLSLVFFACLLHCR